MSDIDSTKNIRYRNKSIEKDFKITYKIIYKIICHEISSLIKIETLNILLLLKRKKEKLEEIFFQGRMHTLKPKKKKE